MNVWKVGLLWYDFVDSSWLISTVPANRTPNFEWWWNHFVVYKLFEVVQLCFVATTVDVLFSDK